MRMPTNLRHNNRLLLQLKRGFRRRFCVQDSRSCGLNCCDNGGTPANFIFGLGPGEPTRYGVTNFNGNYQSTSNGNGLWVWPAWGGRFSTRQTNFTTGIGGT